MYGETRTDIQDYHRIVVVVTVSTPVPLPPDCHLQHPAIHQSTALVVLTMIRLLAYALSLVLYQRQICSHPRGSCDSFPEFAKRLAYGFVVLAINTS